MKPTIDPICCRWATRCPLSRDRPYPFRLRSFGLFSFLMVLFGLLSAFVCEASATDTRLETGILSGEGRVWHRITIDFAGPSMNEDDVNPNPFLDFRLEVTFLGPNGQAYRVPGFFDGDGNGGGSGRIWRVRFAPDSPGWWTYEADFRSGTHIAISRDPDEGRPTLFNGTRGRFLIQAQLKRAEGFLGKGRLVHQKDSYYLKTLGDGKFWIKGGTDSPENFLGYAGFDNTHPNPDHPEWFHRFSKHVRHWGAGDPNWEGDGGDGKGIIGALNYLFSKHVNSVYIILNNIGGDGQDVWPYSGKINRRGHADNDNTHFDISKLTQWETVFSHAQKRGILLHFVLNEGERANKRELDNATLGVERKLFYREMIARFAHHNGIQWNLCEEYDGRDLPLNPEEVKNWAGFVKALDAYGHPLTVHNWSPSAWEPFFGDERFDMVSYQYRGDVDYGMKVEDIRSNLLEAGRVMPVSMDETNHASQKESDGCRVSGWLRVCGQQTIRKKLIYPVYFSGGSLELILEELLATEDFENYDRVWDDMFYARSFVEALPFWDMAPNDALLIETKGKGEVFANDTVLAIYLPEGGERYIDLRQLPGSFIQRWYNPRKGVFEGGRRIVRGGDIVSLGLPPSNPSKDWVTQLDTMSGSVPPTP